MQEKPNYYSVIPASVRYNKELPFGARLLYSEIAALSNREGYCYALNNYFAELYDVSADTISRWIKQLESFGYIIIVYKTNGAHVDSRHIYINDTPGKNAAGGNNAEQPPAKMPVTPGKNAEDNININIKNNKYSENEKKQHLPDLHERNQRCKIDRLKVIEKWNGSGLWNAGGCLNGIGAQNICVLSDIGLTTADVLAAIDNYVDYRKTYTKSNFKLNSFLAEENISGYLPKNYKKSESELET